MPKRLLIKRAFDLSELIVTIAVGFVVIVLIASAVMHCGISEECQKNVKRWVKEVPELKKFIKENAKKEDNKINFVEYKIIADEYDRLKTENGHKELMVLLEDVKTNFN